MKDCHSPHFAPARSLITWRAPSMQPPEGWKPNWIVTEITSVFQRFLWTRTTPENSLIQPPPGICLYALNVGTIFILYVWYITYKYMYLCIIYKYVYLYIIHKYAYWISQHCLQVTLQLFSTHIILGRNF